MTSSERASGDAVRREVLGDEYVDGVSDTWAGAAQMQDLVVRFAWGTVWSRPGFDRTTRSLLTVAVLTALNRKHELELHIGGALRNGCTVDDLVEVALHCAVYCGMPAAIDTVRLIKQVSDRRTPAGTAAAAPPRS
ncbi:carboxymuconolactone decarboxylase family protein [Streptomyces gamaensis]|uniref:Carboxymuconolactone decarboxylase family protein n=1 Tax=Streptomyces gamaensis TaxID=1763542 RepID=A0ABW0ZAA8_9ACTN